VCVCVCARTHARGLAPASRPAHVHLRRLCMCCVTHQGNFHYHGGQYVFLCFPDLGIFQWHPFSLSSAPFEKEVTLHVRVLGNWTKSLYALVAKQRGSTKLKAYIDGPYGEPSVDVEGSTYKCFLLVSGGIGITPMQVREQSGACLCVLACPSRLLPPVSAVHCQRTPRAVFPWARPDKTLVHLDGGWEVMRCVGLVLPHG